MISAAIAALMVASAAPSFDCAKASGVERTVCAEPRLAALDARLTDLYRRALRTAPAEAETTRQAQRAWLRQRNEACAKAERAAPCLDGYYRSRIETLERQQRRRDESLGHPPNSGTFADFIGRWRVVGVTAADDAGEVTNFGTDEPRYMGLELSAGPGEVRWLNGNDVLTAAAVVCRGPSFTPRSVTTPLPAGWKAVSLACKDGEQWNEELRAFTLKARDLAELEWDGGALLHLKRVSADAKTPPSPPVHSEPPPLPLPANKGGGRVTADEDGNHVTADDKAYFLALQSAVRRHDREWFAKQGGVRVNRQDGASYAYRPEEVREVYDWIITPEVERAILTQSPDSLGKTWDGVMAAGGTVWFDQFWIDKHWVYEIKAVNQMAHRRGS